MGLVRNELERAGRRSRWNYVDVEDSISINRTVPSVPLIWVPFLSNLEEV